MQKDSPFNIVDTHYDTTNIELDTKTYLNMEKSNQRTYLRAKMKAKKLHESIKKNKPLKDDD